MGNTYPSGKCRKCGNDSDGTLYDDVSGAQANDEAEHDGFDTNDPENTLSTNEILLLTSLIIFVLMVITLCTCYFIRRRIKNKYQKSIEEIEESKSIEIEAHKEEDETKQITNENEIVSK